MGFKKGQFKKGHTSWHKGKTGVYSEETLQKMSNAKKGKKPNNYKPNIIECFGCGKKFHRKKHHANRNKMNFCTKKCFDKWRRKYYFTDPKVRKAMSEAQLGKKHSKATRLKFKELNSGSNHPQWKGGITPVNKRIRSTIEYIEWRKKVFERDNYTCQKCGARCGIGKPVFLHPHHIKSFAYYPKLRFDVNNGLTLCKECHLNLHKIHRITRRKPKCLIKQYQRTMLY